MGGSKENVARIREALDGLVDLSGLSRREIERRLAQNGSGFDVSRLLVGRFGLKLDQLLDLLRVLEIHPVEFFRLVFKEPERRSPLLVRVRALYSSDEPVRQAAARGAESDLDTLRRRLDEMEQRIEQLRVKPK
jgi:hypothetical protein